MQKKSSLQLILGRTSAFKSLWFIENLHQAVTNGNCFFFVFFQDQVTEKENISYIYLSFHKVNSVL